MTSVTEKGIKASMGRASETRGGADYHKNNNYYKFCVTGLHEHGIWHHVIREENGAQSMPANYAKANTSADAKKLVGIEVCKHLVI